MKYDIKSWDICHPSLKKLIWDNYSEFERQVMIGYLEGKPYSLMAWKFNRSVKSIDNALQRVRRKFNYFINNNHA